MTKYGVAFLFLLFTGCNIDSGNSGNADLSYEFNINRDCQGRFCKPDDNEKCETKANFNSQAEYCEGLRSDLLNKGCARRERKARFFERCGPAFEDIQLQGWTVACANGKDENSTLPVFSNRSEFCQDLGNPVHTECSAALRNLKFEWYECGR